MMTPFLLLLLAEKKMANRFLVNFSFGILIFLAGMLTPFCVISNI